MSTAPLTVADQDAADYSVAGWAKVASFVLSLIGLALSIYLTITHFQPQALVCSGTGFIDCAKVTTSAQSEILGIPVAILGLANYTLMTALNSPWAWRARSRWVHVARFALGIISICFVLWLLYAELIIIGNICLYCTGVHITTFLLFVVLMTVCPAQLGWTRSRSS
ncbi:MAG TPA: vitamin K epoxide reductase family protein [Acidimicrobiales bacterium]|nr:vitamin K epoxide reductase family protein [Acidimicrobiales bacterium]